jgi:hypothetical protein
VLAKVGLGQLFTGRHGSSTGAHDSSNQASDLEARHVEVTLGTAGAKRDFE